MELLTFFVFLHRFIYSELGSKFENERPKSKILDLRQILVNEKIAETGGSNAGVFSCYIDGWNCVMKELDISGSSEETIDRFSSEIKLLESLTTNSYISRYLHHERKGDKLRLYITRYSCSLYDYISKYGEQVQLGQQDIFSPSQILRFAKNIVNGLLFLHKNNIIHRDLKTSNLFVRFDEHNELKNIVIGDFDTAKRLSTTNKAKTIAGTVPYMAPEIILSTDDSNYSFPVDIWSFGMILYEITTLEAPFVNEDPMVIQERIIKKKIYLISIYFLKRLISLSNIMES